MKPPKAPLLMTRTTSPGRVASATARTRRSTSASARASTPRARSSATTPLGVEPLVRGGTMSWGSGTWRATHGAPASASTYSAWWMRRRLVFDRGSKTAQSRRSGKRARMAAIVARTAVGWCAKSSMTRTPPDLSAHLLPAPHAREGGETPRDLLEAEPEVARRGHDAERVLDVVGAATGQGRDAEHAVALQDREPDALRAVRRGRARRSRGRERRRPRRARR